MDVLNPENSNETLKTVNKKSKCSCCKHMLYQNSKHLVIFIKHVNLVGDTKIYTELFSLCIIIDCNISLMKL